MSKVLLVDMEKCTGCKQCSLACSLTKEKFFDPLRSRIKILKRERTAMAVQLLCEQCSGHPCTDACPEDALSRDDTTGIISVDEDLCTGCGACAEVCPYHAIRLDPETEVPLICDLCAGDPYCVQHCVPEALMWVEETDERVKEKKKLRAARMAEYKTIMEES